MSTKDLGLVTAYGYAKDGGYTGTEAQFRALLANVAIDLAEIENLSVTVTTLPADSDATASYDSGVLSLGIPKGDDGVSPSVSAEPITGGHAVSITDVEGTTTFNVMDGEVSQAELDALGIKVVNGILCAVYNN